MLVGVPFAPLARLFAPAIDALALGIPIPRDQLDQRILLGCHAAGFGGQPSVDLDRAEPHVDRSDRVPFSELPLDECRDQAPRHAGPARRVGGQIGREMCRHTGGLQEGGKAAQIGIVAPRGLVGQALAVVVEHAARGRGVGGS